MRLMNEEDCNIVLENGPYLMNRKIVGVRRWNEEFDFRMEVLAKFPIWFRLPSLPLVCWGQDSLSKN